MFKKESKKEILQSIHKKIKCIHTQCQSTWLFNTTVNSLKIDTDSNTIRMWESTKPHCETENPETTGIIYTKEQMTLTDAYRTFNP